MLPAACPNCSTLCAYAIFMMKKIWSKHNVWPYMEIDAPSPGRDDERKNISHSFAWEMCNKRLHITHDRKRHEKNSWWKLISKHFLFNFFRLESHDFREKSFNNGSMIKIRNYVSQWVHTNGMSIRHSLFREEKERRTSLVTTEEKISWMNFSFYSPWCLIFGLAPTSQRAAKQNRSRGNRGR